MNDVDLRTLLAVYCLVCGRPARAPDVGRTICEEGHEVQIWDIRGLPPAAPAGSAEGSWRARPPLL